MSSGAFPLDLHLAASQLPLLLLLAVSCTHGESRRCISPQAAAHGPLESKGVGRHRLLLLLQAEGRLCGCAKGARRCIDIGLCRWLAEGGCGRYAPCRCRVSSPEWRRTALWLRAERATSSAEACDCLSKVNTLVTSPEDAAWFMRRESGHCRQCACQSQQGWLHFRFKI